MENDKHRAQWRSTLQTYVYPVFGDLPVSEIDTGLVLKAIEPIWTEKAETAGRVRGRIESILDWARAREYRTGENPARWRGHLENVLPKRSKIARVKHHDAIPYAELPGFIEQIRANQAISARALEFTALTACRTGETIGAKWSEIDLQSKLWTIPAERMKAGREHRIPLSGRAIEILAALPREAGSEYVFPGARAAKPLSNMSMLQMIRGLRGVGATVHGLRSSFKDWALECTAYPGEMSEVALAHTISNKAEAAYRRSDLVAKRARMMEDWAAFCTSPPASGDNVVPMRAAK